MHLDPDSLLVVLKLQPPENSPDERLDGGAAEVVLKALATAVVTAGGKGLYTKAALATLGGSGLKVVGAVADALTVRLREVLVSAWNKREEIRKYCDPAKTPPNEVRYVQLYQHPISWTYKPKVTITVAGSVDFPLELELKLSLTVDQAVLVITGGKATAIQPGKGKVEARASIEGMELCKPATFELGTLPGTLPLTRAESPRAANTAAT